MSTYVTIEKDNGETFFALLVDGDNSKLSVRPRGDEMKIAKAALADALAHVLALEAVDALVIKPLIQMAEQLESGERGDPELLAKDLRAIYQKIKDDK